MAPRFDLGRVLLVIGSALLLISLFLDWYDTGQSGWDVFETLDLLLAALAAAGIALAVTAASAPPWAGIAVPAAVVFIVFVQLVNAPPAAGDGDPDTGIWIALGGGLLMAAGAALALANISVTVQVAERERRRRVAAVDARGGADAVADRDEPAGPAAKVGDVERTQPLTALPDAEPEGPERS